MHRDYERAEAEGDKYPQGRPGSMYVVTLSCAVENAHVDGMMSG